MKNNNTEILAYEPTFGDEMSPKDVVYTWLNNCYSVKIISEYMKRVEPRLLDEAYNQMLETLLEIGADAHATMHYDDPSLIELFSNLDELQKVIKEAYSSVK